VPHLSGSPNLHREYQAVSRPLERLRAEGSVMVYKISAAE